MQETIPVTVRVVEELPYDGALRFHMHNRLLSALELVAIFFQVNALVDITWDVNVTNGQAALTRSDVPKIVIRNRPVLYDEWYGYAHLGFNTGEIARTPYLPTTICHELGHLWGLQHNQYTFMHQHMAAAQSLPMARSEADTIRQTIQPSGRRRNVVVRGTANILRFLRRWFT